jgi:hypothetical protein
MLTVYGFLTDVILLFAFDVVRVDMVGLLPLIMRPGGYRVKNYVRAGTGMTLIFMAVVMIMFWAVYGMAA